MQDPSKILSSQYIIVSIDKVLFRKGILLSYTEDQATRSWFYQPWLVFTFVLAYMLLSQILGILIAKDNISRYIGLPGHLFGMKTHYCLFLLLCSMFCLSSHLIHYYNYVNEIKPTFLLVFQMISGTISPESVGLHRAKNIERLANITRYLIRIISFNNDRVIPLIATTFQLYIYWLNESSADIFVLGIPHSILISTHGHYLWNNIGYHFMHFYIVSLFMKKRLRCLNSKLTLMKASRSPDCSEES